MSNFYIYQVVEDREPCHPQIFSTLEEAQRQMIHDFMEKMRYNMDAFMKHLTDEFNKLPVCKYACFNRFFVYYTKNVGITTTIPDDIKNVYIGDRKTYEEMIYEMITNPFEEIDPLYNEEHWGIDTLECWINKDDKNIIFYDYDARIFSMDAELTSVVINDAIKKNAITKDDV